MEESYPLDFGQSHYRFCIVDIYGFPYQFLSSQLDDNRPHISLMMLKPDHKAEMKVNKEGF